MAVRCLFHHSSAMALQTGAPSASSMRFIGEPEHPAQAERLLTADTPDIAVNLTDDMFQGVYRGKQLHRGESLNVHTVRKT